MTSRAWIFTVFEYSHPIWTLLPAHVKYLVWQKEKCPDTGRLHCHVYAEYRNSYRLSQARTILFGEGPQHHGEKRKGKREDAIAYCKKAESRIAGPWELGEAETQGTRNDLRAICDALKAGKTMREAVSEDLATTYVRNYRGLAAYEQLLAPPPQVRDIEVYVFWGPTGTGKTYVVWCSSAAKSGNLCVVDYTDKRLWFPGANARTEALLFDEFDCQLHITEMLRILQGYPIPLPVKGSNILCNYRTVFLTSNSDPTTWYAWATPEQRAALARRLTNVHHFSSRADSDQFLSSRSGSPAPPAVEPLTQ